MAWLPGTQGGEAIANSIFGAFRFMENKKANRLPADWMSDMKSI